MLPARSFPKESLSILRGNLKKTNSKSCIRNQIEHDGNEKDMLIFATSHPQPWCHHRYKHGLQCRSPKFEEKNVALDFNDSIVDPIQNAVAATVLLSTHHSSKKKIGSLIPCSDNTTDPGSSPRDASSLFSPHHHLQARRTNKSKTALRVYHPHSRLSRLRGGIAGRVTIQCSVELDTF